MGAHVLLFYRVCYDFQDETLCWMIMKKVAALLFLLSLALPAHAQSDLATEADLEANRNRDAAWDSYKDGLRENDNPLRAIEYFLTARTSWSREGKLQLYKKKRVIRTVPRIKLIKLPSKVDYYPTVKLFACFEKAKRDAIRRARRLPQPRAKNLVTKRFKKLFELIEKLERHKVRPVRLINEKKELKKLIEELLKPLAEEKATPKANADGKMERDKKTERKAVEKDDSPAKTNIPSVEERLGRRKLELKLHVENLKAFTLEGNRCLKNGDLKASVASVNSATRVLLKLAYFPVLDSQSKADVALVCSHSHTLSRRSRAMLAVSAALTSSARLETRRQIFQAGLKTARDIEATRWSHIQQQKMVLQLLKLARQGRGVTSLDLKRWREIFDDPICQQVLLLEIRDDYGSEPDECELWPFPDKSKTVAYANRFVLSQSIRAFTLTEESWHDRQQEASPDARSLSVRGLLALLQVLTRSASLDRLTEQVREKLSKARECLKVEIVKLSYTPLFKDNGQVAERFAASLLLLPDLEAALDAKFRARVLIGIGLAGFKTGDQASFWLVDRGLALDPDVVDKISDEVPKWAIQKVIERKNAKSEGF
jgi:hypothetical protein